MEESSNSQSTLRRKARYNYALLMTRELFICIIIHRAPRSDSASLHNYALRCINIHRLLHNYSALCIKMRGVNHHADKCMKYREIDGD